MLKYSFAIFDFDGTVCDTKAGILKAARYSLEKLGLPPASEEELSRFIGPSLWHSYGEFYSLYGKEAEEAVRLYREYYDEHGIFEMRVYPGMAQMLEALKEGGITLAIASSKNKPAVSRALEFTGLDDYFSLIVAASPSGELSNKTESIAFALKELKCKPGEAVYIGDSRSDALGAIENGISFIAACYDRSASEFDGIPDAAFAYSVDEIPSLLGLAMGRQT